MRAILCAIEIRAVYACCISVSGIFIGETCVYDKQALVLVYRGGATHPATGGEVMTLAKAIQTSVYERFGIRLEPVV